MSLEIEWAGSPNKRKGRNGFRPEAIVIHIMEGTLPGTDAWFNNPGSNVSAHYGIGQSGAIHQYVLDTDTAFHAGRRRNATWKLVKPRINPNLYTLGIEHEGRGETPWGEKMYQASAALIADLSRRWSISVDRDHIIGHSEIFDAKTCPGKGLDIVALVNSAKEELLDPANYNFVKREGEVRTRVDLNLRAPAPTVQATALRIVPAGTTLAFVGWTSNGQAVSGNAHWYRDSTGNYFWAGGTNRQTPGIGGRYRIRG